MDTSLTDGLIVVGLLAGSAACVAGCLWGAHRVGLVDALERAQTRGSGGAEARFRGVRMGLGVVALGVCVAMMVGAVPGTAYLHGWTSLACVGCGLLGMLTIGTAQRERVVGLGESQATSGRAGSTQAETSESRRTAA